MNLVILAAVRIESSTCGSLGREISDVEIGVVGGFVVARLHLRSLARGVQLRPDDGQALGDVEPHVGHRVAGQVQDGREHEAFSDLGSASLGQNLKIFSNAIE